MLHFNQMDSGIIMGMISEESRERYRQSKLGAKNPMFGKRCLHKDKISAALKGKMPKNFSLLLNPKLKQKRTENLIRFNQSMTGKKKKSDRSLGSRNHFYGKKHSIKSLAKMSESHKANPALYSYGENHHNWKGGEEWQQKRRKEWKQNNKQKVYFAVRKREIMKRAIGNHSFEQWDDLKKKYNYMCLCCKQQEPFIKLTEDHIIPLSRGGSNDISNIQPLCLSCNSRKFTSTRNYINNTTILL